MIESTARVRVISVFQPFPPTSPSSSFLQGLTPRTKDGRNGCACTDSTPHYYGSMFPNCYYPSSFDYHRTVFLPLYVGNIFFRPLLDSYPTPGEPKSNASKQGLDDDGVEEYSNRWSEQPPPPSSFFHTSKIDPTNKKFYGYI